MYLPNGNESEKAPSACALLGRTQSMEPKNLTINCKHNVLPNGEKRNPTAPLVVGYIHDIFLPNQKRHLMWMHRTATSGIYKVTPWRQCTNERYVQRIGFCCRTLRFSIGQNVKARNQTRRLWCRAMVFSIRQNPKARNQRKRLWCRPLRSSTRQNLI